MAAARLWGRADLRSRRPGGSPAHRYPALQQSRPSVKLLTWTVATHSTPADSRVSSLGEAGAPDHFFWLPLNSQSSRSQDVYLAQKRAVARQQFLTPGTEGDGCHLHSLSVAMALGSPGFPASSLSDVSLKRWILT